MTPEENTVLADMRRELQARTRASDEDMDAAQRRARALLREASQRPMTPGTHMRLIVPGTGVVDV